MADNAQKTPLGLSLNRWARGKVADQIAITGQSLPCTVTKVLGSVVTVEFQITAVAGQPPITLPSVTIPAIGAEYVRLPIQVGCRGMTVASDVYLGGVSGIGGGTATTARTGNLTGLAFVPLGNVNFFAVNGQVLTLYGPSGVTLMDAGQTTHLNLTPGQVQIIASGHTLTVGAGGIVMDGIVFETHYHVAPSGGGDTGVPL